MDVVQSAVGALAVAEANEVADELRTQLRELRRLEGEALKLLATAAQKQYAVARSLVEEGQETQAQFAAFDRAVELAGPCTDWLSGPDGTECQAFHKSLGEILAAFDATRARVRELAAEGRHDDAFAAAVEMMLQYPPPDLVRQLEFPVAVTSRPVGARIAVDGVDTGLRTPATVLLPLRAGCQIVLSADGFAPTLIDVPVPAEVDPRQIEPLLARRLETGLRRTTRFVSPPLKGRLEAPAQCADGLALFPTRGDECAVLDLATGEVTESLGLRNPNGAVAQPAIVGGTVAIPTVDGRVYFHDLVRRSLTGSYVAPGGLRTDPLVHEGAVILAVDSGHVVCVDVVTQRERWRYPEIGRPPLAQPATGAPRLVGSELYHVTADGLVTVLDAASGRRLREIRVALHARTASLRHGTLVKDDALIAATSDGYLVRADLRTGATVWSAPLDARAAFAPVASGEHVAVALENGQLVLVRAGDGRILVRRELGAKPVVDLAVDQELLLVATEGGVLHALEMSDDALAPVWEYAARDSDEDPVRITTRPVVRDAVVVIGADDGRVRAIQR